MILGLGIDVVRTDRLRKWDGMPGLFERFFHPDELETVRLRGGNGILSLAARFAAKEAFGKALGTGLKGLALKDIRVYSAHNGKPEIRLEGKAKAAFEAIGGKSIHVSLTHEHDNALAVVVIEGGP